MVIRVLFNEYAAPAPPAFYAGGACVTMTDQAFKEFIHRRRLMSDQNDVVITCNNNGPLRVNGDNIVIKDAAGNAFGLAGRKVITLCRCGYSDNKPSCDGSHARNGFQSQVEAKDLPPPAPKP